MARYPKIETLSNNAVDIINAVKNSAGQDYKNYVPYVTPDSDSLKAMGAVVMDRPSLLNEFIDTLSNVIGMRVVTSKMYENPWAFMKKGILDYGETVEENFVTLIKPHEYDPYVAQNELFKNEVPDVRTAFHIRNYQKFYKVTINYDLLRDAFASWGAMGSFIDYIFAQMYTSANYDEYIVMKYMLQRVLCDGLMTPYDKPINNTNTMAKTMRAMSDNFTLMSPNYNLAHVHNFTLKNDQFLFMDTFMLAEMDVDELAVAFNMDKVNFMGHVVAIDGFDKTDNDRLNELLSPAEWYRPLNAGDLETLANVSAVLVGRDWFQIYDNLIRRTNIENPDALSYNYDLHVWKTFSFSPFENAVVFSSVAPAVTSVTVNPATATLDKGASLQLSATVATTGFAPKSVTWESNNPNAVSVSPRGMVKVSSTAESETQVTIIATSTFDSSKKNTCTITVA